MEPIGKSRYAELDGVVQYLGTKEMADHFNSAAYQFDHDARRHGNGRRMVANEGYRPKGRCDLLWNEYVARGYRAPKVATRYTSNHYVGARAVDVGIMTKDGTYDVPTDAEFNEIHDHLAAHGFYWAGQNFGEAWHHEYVGGGPKPVIPDVNQAGDPYYDKPVTPVTPPIGRKKIMFIDYVNDLGHVLITDHGTYKFDYLTVSGKQVSGSEQVALMARVINSNQSAVTDKNSKTLEKFNKQQFATIQAVLREVK